MTVSHKSTTKLVQMLGKDHDQLVKNWRDSFLPSLNNKEEVVVSVFF